MTNAAPPAWYPDPADPGRQRWWDGTAWGPVAQASASPHAGYPGGSAVGGKTLVTPDGTPLADYWPRVVAYLIDGFLMSMVQLILSIPFFGQIIGLIVDYADEMSADPSEVDPFWIYGKPGFWIALGGMMLVGLCVSAAYSITQLKTRGATVGKSAMGLRVRPWQADVPLTWGQATQRWLSSAGLATLVSFYVYIDLLWPAWDEKRQALHDKWPGTVVVQRSPR